MTYRVLRCQPSSYLENLIVRTGVNWTQDQTTQHVSELKEFNSKFNKRSQSTKSVSTKGAPPEDKRDELKKTPLQTG